VISAIIIARNSSREATDKTGYTNMFGVDGDSVGSSPRLYAFHHLENRRLTGNEGRRVDGFCIGLPNFLFFFENMLMRQNQTGVRELAVFLEDSLRDRYSLEGEGAYTLAKQVVETMRPASGKGLKRQFYNYETGQMEEVAYAILRADDWDPDKKIQYYTLDEQGLELIFATKEYFSEFQISISQLVLRKQLEKGEFSGALRQVDEMRINVQNIRDKMVKIKHEIQRNIISDDTYDRYKEIIEDINRRLQQEHDEFEELVTFIHETKGHLDQGNHTQKDLEALEMIVRVDNELAHVHYLHASLLKDSIELKTTAIEAAGESLYYAGVTSFNFDQEVARKMTTGPLPFVAAKELAAPFTRIRKFSAWSLLSVFDQQMLDRPDRHKNSDFLELEEETTAQETKVRQQVNALLFRELMSAIEGKERFELTEVLKASDSPVFGTREFCDIWIIIHQLSPVSIKAIMDIDDHIFATAFAETLAGYDRILVEELEEEVSLKDNYTMKNMRMTLEVTGGEDHDR